MGRRVRVAYPPYIYLICDLKRRAGKRQRTRHLCPNHPPFMRLTLPNHKNRHMGVPHDA